MLQPNTIPVSPFAPPPRLGKKRCLRCGTGKRSAFGTDVSRPDQLNPYCRDCAREMVEQSRTEMRAARAAFKARLGRLSSKRKKRRANPLSSTCKTCGAAPTPELRVWLRRGWQYRVSLALARRRYHRKEGNKSCMGSAEIDAAKLVRFPDRVAAILAKSVACQGDAFELDDAEALVMILDIINELDPTLIERNANKKLARHRQPS
jgi:hypothetical protein